MKGLDQGFLIRDSVWIIQVVHPGTFAYCTCDSFDRQTPSELLQMNARQDTGKMTARFFHEE